MTSKDVILDIDEAILPHEKTISPARTVKSITFIEGGIL